MEPSKWFRHADRPIRQSAILCRRVTLSLFLTWLTLAGVTQGCSSGDSDSTSSERNDGKSSSSASSNTNTDGICIPDCSDATCLEPKDTCGGECPGVCGEREDGCTIDVHCPAGYLCLGDADGSSTCLPSDCAFRVLEPPLCGEPGAMCGDKCPACTPDCTDMECGPDPNCGQSCGTCEDTHYCGALGMCMPRGDFCEGDVAVAHQIAITSRFQTAVV